jgi:N-acetylglucosaminyldiphosphoundecaprenol N-acetyl-beta-D-mannosaminyltransferase
MVAIDRFEVARVPVSLVNMQMACAEVERRYHAREGGYFIFRDMNGIVGAQDDPQLLSAHRNAALIAPDGMPLVWLAHLNGFRNVGRVYGPDFMLELCRISENTDLKHFLFGSTERVLEKLIVELTHQFPQLKICGSYSPPVLPPAQTVSLDDVARIRSCGADIVWVGLGTPKQELWMQAHGPHLPNSILMGVGAAFDFHAKLKRQPPRWMQRAGLGWCFRLMSEPRRLGKRYLVGIPRFLFLIARHGCAIPPRLLNVSKN